MAETRSVPLAAIDVCVGYNASDISTVPTSSTSFVRMHDFKSTGDLNPSPNTADASTFDNVAYTTFVELLKDIGGAVDFTVNLTDNFINEWETCLGAISTNGGVWFGIYHPSMSKMCCFFGKPSILGMPSLTANSLMEATVSITPMSEPQWITAGTDKFKYAGET